MNSVRIILASFLFSLLLSIPISSASTLNQSLTYDGNGNLITGDGKFREYNEFNQLIKVYDGNSSSGTLLEEYIHHPTEERILVKKFNDATLDNEDETIVYINENFVRVYNLKGIREINDTYYVKDENGIIAQIMFNGTDNTPIFTQGAKLFYHNDHKGSTSVITNSSGSLVEETFYAPYGEILSGGAASRYDYEGKEFDSFTEDYDFNFRKYNSGFGIFTQPDSIIQDQYDPQLLNKYAFERRNPYRYTDPDGHILDTLLDIGFIAYDLYELYQDPEDPANRIALAADVAAAFIPFVTGAGIVARGGAKGAKAIGKAGEAAKLNRDVQGAAKSLKETGEVTVGSFSEANKLRATLFPQAKKVPGAGPSTTKASESLFKGRDVYKTDYLFDPKTGRIYGHSSKSPHSTVPHINVKSGGNKYTIIVEKIKNLFKSKTSSKKKK